MNSNAKCIKCGWMFEVMITFLSDDRYRYNNASIVNDISIVCSLCVDENVNDKNNKA